MSAIQVRIFDNADQLAREMAGEFVEIVQVAISQHGRCVAALAGGSTPRRLYQVLATDEFRNRIDWQNLHVFISDERHVPLDHPESNFGMAQQELLQHVAIPEEHVHPVATDLEPIDTARAYERSIRDVFNSDAAEIPAFDLILLGIGADGHTASLFPGTRGLSVHDRLVTENWVPQQGSMRISFTIPLLQAARRTVLMATGEDKADAVARAVEGEPDLDQTPSQILRDARGSVTFALDRAAASKLTN